MDELTIMNFKLKCFPFHKWSSWETVEKGNMFGDGFGGMTKLPTGSYVVQQRKCLVCLKLEMNKIRI